MNLQERLDSMNYNTILNRMLSNVPTNVDKREGSIIYDAVAPAALEIQHIVMELESILHETFADTASREYLIKRAAERGITPLPAAKAVLLGEFNTAVPIGSRFSIESLIYQVKEQVDEWQYQLQCETAGTIGNRFFGTLIPLEYIEGLETAEITQLLIPGEDDEETEALRKRYYESLNARAYGGNIRDYETKVSEISGVGGVKVYPVWNGGGTVKLVIIDSTFHRPTDQMVSEVQTLIDPIENQGEGVGIAPIGHVVKVMPVEKFEINIQTEIVYQGNWEWATAESHINDAIDAYFLELAEDWASEEQLVVRISQIETRLLQLEAVLDISNTTLNGSKENLILGADDIPARGTVTANE